MGREYVPVTKKKQTKSRFNTVAFELTDPRTSDKRIPTASCSHVSLHHLIQSLPDALNASNDEPPEQSRILEEGEGIHVTVQWSVSPV